MKILYSADFLVHGDYEKLVPHLFNDIVFKAIERSGVTIELFNKHFSRKVFFDLSNIANPTERYFRFSQEISDESKEYLKKSINDAIILGFELNKKTKDLFNEIGVTYINCWIHPFKLLDDLAFAFESNNSEIAGRMMQFSQPQEKLQLYGLYWRERIKRSFKIPKIPTNSLLLIGQSEVDQSLVSGDKMLSMNDYESELVELRKKYEIIYAPHPSSMDRFGNLVLKNKPNLAKFIAAHNPKIVKAPTYSLLASGNVVAVRAISSSVVAEAKYFGKESGYFFQPLFDDSICIMQDYFYPQFWAGVLGIEFLPPVGKAIQFDVVQNKVRDMMQNAQLYWGYKELDNVRILLDDKKSREKSLFGKLRKCFKYIL